MHLELQQTMQSKHPHIEVHDNQNWFSGWRSEVAISTMKTNYRYDNEDVESSPAISFTAMPGRGEPRREPFWMVVTHKR